MGKSLSISDLAEIYQMLEDDESKDIYLKRLCYLISGDFKAYQGTGKFSLVRLYFPD